MAVARKRNSEGTSKLEDLAFDQHVNLSYYKDRTREWISVSGVAIVIRDRQKIHELYAPDWSIWFPKEGDPRHGRRTIRGWGSSVSTCTRQCSSK